MHALSIRKACLGTGGTEQGMKGSVSVSRPQSRNHSSAQALTEFSQRTAHNSGQGSRYSQSGHHRARGSECRPDSSMSPGPSPGLDQAGASDNTQWTKRCFTNVFSRREVFLSYIPRPEVGGCSQSPKTLHTAIRSLGVTEEKIFSLLLRARFCCLGFPFLISGCVREHLCVRNHSN